jgi:holin-like protein
LNLPVPGPIVGLLLMLAYLLVRRNVAAPLEATSRGLLSYLSLLFVPAGVGIVRYLDLIERYWLPIAAAIVGSTLLTMAVTFAVMHALTRRARA